MPFATKQNKKLKFKGVRNTTTLKLKQDILLTPPHPWVKHCPQCFER